MTMSYTIRSMLTEDIPHIMQIETAQQKAPWSPHLFYEALQHGDKGWVAYPLAQDTDLDFSVLGYALIKECVHTADLLTLATHPHALRQHIASTLLKHIKTYLSQKNIVDLFLEVANSNTAAQALYLKEHFKPIQTRKNYYAYSGSYQQREDAIVMLYSCTERKEHDS